MFEIHSLERLFGARGGVDAIIWQRGACLDRAIIYNAASAVNMGQVPIMVKQLFFQHQHSHYITTLLPPLIPSCLPRLIKNLNQTFANLQLVTG